MLEDAVQFGTRLVWMWSSCEQRAKARVEENLAASSGAGLAAAQESFPSCQAVVMMMMMIAADLWEML